jgi:hypothetical protein
MLVQPQQAATVCELDLVQRAIRSWKRAQTLDSKQRPGNAHEPLNLTLDVGHAHVSGYSWTDGELHLPAPLFAHLKGALTLIIHTQKHAMRYPIAAALAKAA